MKVILLKDVRGVGQHFDVKDVSDGYAQNFLFPKGFAEMASPEKVQSLVAQKEAKEAVSRKGEETLHGNIMSLRGKVVSLTARATEKGGLFKTIAAGDIARAILSQYEVEIPESVVYIAEAIKTVGEHVVVLQHKDQKIEIGVRVTAAS